MKKILSIFMVIAVMLTLAGCGDRTGQAADSQTGSRGTEEEAGQSTAGEAGQETKEEAGQSTGQGTGQGTEDNVSQSAGQEAGRESGSTQDGSAGSMASSEEDTGTQQSEASKETTELRDDYKDNFDVDGEAAAEFGRMIKEAVAQKDVEKLAGLTGFPVYVGLSGGIVVETKDDFIALDVEELLSDEMLSSMADADENALSPSMAGFTLYGSKGAPSITFGVREGRLAISGINYGY